jgi:hypothetical protein
MVISNTEGDATGVVVSDTLPAGLAPEGPVTITPPDSGQVGTLPTLARNLVIRHALTVTLTLPVRILDGPAVMTNVVAVTCTEVLTPVSASIVITAANVAPTADAGGPYQVEAGRSITLHGSGSDPAGSYDPLTFAWDLDDNGSYETSGADPLFDATGKGPGVYTVTLRVSDDDGGVGTDSANVSVARWYVYLPVICK